jgi:hypothetical protein
MMLVCFCRSELPTRALGFELLSFVKNLCDWALVAVTGTGCFTFRAFLLLPLWPRLGWKLMVGSTWVMRTEDWGWLTT